MGINDAIPNAAYPTGGQGLVLDPRGKIPWQARSVASSTTPPTNPFDGQLWRLVADSTNGVTWMFQYNGTTGLAYPWEFVGGPPYFSEVATGEATASAAFVDLATVGPQIILPRAGSYVFSWGAGGFTATANTQINLGLIQSGVGEIVRVVSNIGAGNTSMTLSRSTRATMPAAADMRIQYACGANTTFDRRWMSVVPTAVS